jgi:hypothetical protein
LRERSLLILTKTKILLTLSILTVVLFGCKSNEDTVKKATTNIKLQSEKSSKLKLESEIAKIYVLKSIGGTGTKFFEDDKTIETFKNVISSAEKSEGIVNMSSPEFFLDVNYVNGNGKLFYLRLGEKGQRSSLMDHNDTHTIYTVSEEMTAKLIDLLSSSNQQVKENENNNELTKQIDVELNRIINSTEFMLFSGSPLNYFENNHEQFDYIISKKDITLNHFLNNFSENQKNVREEHFMALICVEILGEKNPVKEEWFTGREWYVKYSKFVKDSK